MHSVSAAPARVFAPGTFSHENKGDAALLVSFRSQLERHLGAVEITLASNRPDLASSMPDWRVVPMPLDPHGVSARLLHRVGNVVHPRLTGALAAGQLAAFDLFWQAAAGVHRVADRALLDEVARADLVAFVPGGYLMAPEHNADLWLYHASSIVAASRLGKPIVVFPSSFGPFVGVHRSVARRLLNRCGVIMAREQTSFDLLKQLGVHRPQLRLAPDAAFAFRDDGRGEAAIQPLLERLRAAGLPLIGISAMLHLFPGAADRTAQWSRYVRALSAAARYCRDELGATVVFVPQSTGGAGEDRDAAREVALSAGVDGIEVIDRELSAYELSALYAHLELMIGTRMHANIMAMAVGTPVVAIGYEHKTAGIMEMAGMSAYAIPIRDLDPVPLVGIVQGAWFRRGETRGQLRTIVPRLVDELDLAVAEALQSVTLARQGR